MIHMFRRRGKWLDKMLCLELCLSCLLSNFPFLSNFPWSISLSVLAQALQVRGGVLGRWVSRWVGGDVVAVVALLDGKGATGVTQANRKIPWRLAAETPAT